MLKNISRGLPASSKPKTNNANKPKTNNANKPKTNNANKPKANNVKPKKHLCKDLIKYYTIKYKFKTI